MATTQKNPWDRRKGEPEEAYARFLIYRNLGPARTMDGAYAAYAGAAKRGKTDAPGNWWEEAARYDWRARAAAWDVAMLSEVGREVITTFTASLLALAMKTLEILKRPDMAPKSWKATLETIRVLHELIDPQAIERLSHHPADGGGGGNAPARSVAGKVG